jgi:hypothetical protein
VYVVTSAGGALRATPLQTFRELRPEGVALAPDPGRIAIVFDRGRDAPMWTTIELPRGNL